MQTATQQLGEQAVKKLLRWCRGESWMGYDPYDGLNSPVARLWPMRNRPARTALTQLVKRSPVNLRPLLGIRKAANPKGLALAARAVLLLAGRENESLPTDLLAELLGGGLWLHGKKASTPDAPVLKMYLAIFSPMNRAA